MGKVIMGAVVSLDGFIADDNDDDVGPLFDWYGNGDVAWRFPNSPEDSRSSQASAEFMTSHYANMAVVVIGRLAEPLQFDNPSTVVQGDRVTHLVYDVSR